MDSELSPEELLELERELDMDYEEGESDEEGWDELETKLKTALHESEQVSAGGDLTHLDGFEQFRRTSTAMGKQILHFSKTLTEVQEQSEAAGGAMGLEEKKDDANPGLKPSIGKSDLLSMVDIFELALGAATRGALSYCVSEVEARHTKLGDDDKRMQLEKIRAEQNAREVRSCRYQVVSFFFANSHPSAA